MTDSEPLRAHYREAAATQENGVPTLKPSRKVVAAAVVNVVGIAAVAVLSAVTPDMLDSLGSWGVLAYAGIASVATSLAAYFTPNGSVR